MTKTSAVYVAMLAMSFGICPLISRAAGLPGGWTAFLIAVGTLPVVAYGIGGWGPCLVSVGALSVMMLGICQLTGLPPFRCLAICLIAGVVNGFGLYAYGQLVSGQWEISRVLPVALVAAPVIIAIGARIFFGEALTATKIAGISAVAVGIWLLH